VAAPSRRACVLSDVPLVVDRHNREEPGRRQLLALHQLRRHLERFAAAGTKARSAAMAVAHSSQLLRDLRELITALDRRVPQVARAGETSIARDAAALRVKALLRIEELEGQDQESA
jgi:hypothetical protein